MRRPLRRRADGQGFGLRIRSGGFDALPAAGFYELATKVSGGDFALESACVPVAVDTRGGNLTMLFDGGKDATFWFDAPASGTVAMVRGGTYSGSCANVALTDADGQPGR